MLIRMRCRNANMCASSRYYVLKVPRVKRTMREMNLFAVGRLRLEEQKEAASWSVAYVRVDVDEACERSVRKFSEDFIDGLLRTDFPDS